MKISIREAVVFDIDKILEIYSQPAIDNGIVLKTEEAKDIFNIIKSYPNYKIYVAETNKTIVGTIAVLIMHNIGHLGRQSAILESFAVLPEYQNQGTGKALIKYVMGICKEAGCYKITLSADLKRQKAHTFYEKLGFVQHGYSYKHII